MNYDSKLKLEGVKKSRSSTHSLLSEELKKLRRKLNVIPFPFCELECTWIPICIKIQASECLLSSLRAMNQVQPTSESEIVFIKSSWH